VSSGVAVRAATATAAVGAAAPPPGMCAALCIKLLLIDCVLVGGGGGVVGPTPCVWLFCRTAVLAYSIHFLQKLFDFVL